MSRLKSPQDKKRVSLERDCRNVYGENAKASRKGIHKGKQRSHMEERRSVKSPLLSLKGTPDEEMAIDAELKSRLASIQAKRVSFRKTPDQPLKEVLRRKRITGARSLAVSSFTRSVDQLESN
jgi:hypothetical protein